MSDIIERDFYSRSATEVARDLLGMKLVRLIEGQRVSGIIVETEAYTGLDDLASHGRAGKTNRNLPMWEQPGYAYVYLTYGMYWLLNVVCEPPEQPAAVLIRAVEPQEGIAVIKNNRSGRKKIEWTSGPARTTMAFDVNNDQNRVDMTRKTGNLWIEYGQPISDGNIVTGPRIGLGKHVPPKWLKMPWRWWVADNPYVSR